MELQEVINKWEKEINEIKTHIKEHENNFGHPAVVSRERYETIVEILSDIKKTLKEKHYTGKHECPKCGRVLLIPSMRETLSQFYVYLVGQGKFIETNPFDSYKDADNFIKTL